jgi:pimeloyl-ACP methyl ester carboxylesterase
VAKWPLDGLEGSTHIAASFAIAGRYAKFDVPVLLVYGDSDIATTADPLITKFDEALPNSRLMYLKGVNPFPQIL